MIKVGNGTKFESPALKKALEEDFINEAIAHGERTAEDDWHNTETVPCGVCKGSGWDMDAKMSCLACEGTGKYFEVHYGVSDMKMFAWCTQYGLEWHKEYCKALREAEAETLGGVVKCSKGVEYYRVFSLPPVVKWDLQAQGWDVDKLMSDPAGNKELCRKILREYPEFMTTNRINF